MKHEIEIHRTTERKPTLKDGVVEIVYAYQRYPARNWVETWFHDVMANPEVYPLWFSLKNLPKPEPLRKRKP
jgi:hypothetical protein